MYQVPSAFQVTLYITYTMLKAGKAGKHTAAKKLHPAVNPNPLIRESYPALQAAQKPHPALNPNLVLREP